MRIEKRSGEQITRWDEWEKPAGKDRHWKEGRSALELAKAFFRRGEATMPACLLECLNGRAETRGFVADLGVAELKTALPHGAPGPRNHDLWVLGRSASGLCGIGIEAKADENFKDPIGDKHAKALQEREAGGNTNQGVRIETLGQMLFGPDFDVRSERYSTLRYQLLSGAAGTVIQASNDGAELAVFFVYEFETEQTTAKKLEKNAADFKAFVIALLEVHPEAVDGTVAGPFAIELKKGDPAMPLFVCKVRESLLEGQS